MPTGRQPELDPIERGWQEAFDLVIRMRDRSDREIAERLECSRSSVTQRRRGTTRIRPGEIDELAAALEVPAELFYLDVPGIHLWFSEHPEMSIRQYGCMHVTAGQDLRATAVQRGTDRCIAQQTGMADRDLVASNARSRHDPRGDHPLRQSAA